MAQKGTLGLQLLQGRQIALRQLSQLLLPGKLPAAALLQADAADQQAQKVSGGQGRDRAGQTQPQNLRAVNLIPKEAAAAQAQSQGNEKLGHLGRGRGLNLKLRLQLSLGHRMQGVAIQLLELILNGALLAGYGLLGLLHLIAQGANGAQLLVDALKVAAVGESLQAALFFTQSLLGDLETGLTAAGLVLPGLG